MIQLTEIQKELFKKVQEIFEEDTVYAVGGCVRDIILGVEPKDYDFCIGNDVEQIETAIKSSGRRAFCVGKRFGTIACKVEVQGKQYMIEVTQFREEVYSNSRKPDVKFVDNITADLSRRDFTINSMAIRLDTLRLVDPFNGQEDLKNKILRCVGNPKQRFKEDPLRILRAIRFATRLHLEIETKTEEKLKHCVPELLTISKERWMDELDKILLDDNVMWGLYAMWEYKIFNWIIPELSLQLGFNQNSPHHHYMLDMHTAGVVDKCPKEINMRWAALLHDIAKPFVRTEKRKETSIDTYKQWANYIGHDELGAEMVKRIALHLKWSNERTEKVVDLVRNHLKEDSPLREFDNMAK